MKLFAAKEKAPKLTTQQALAAKPVHLVKAQVTEAADGSGKLKVPLRSTPWAGWLVRIPEGTTKTFELDAIGMLVWNACDGKTSVQQIIRRLAKQYHLNLREAQVPTLAFLRTLAKKGLVGMSLPVEEERK